MKLEPHHTTRKKHASFKKNICVMVSHECADQIHAKYMKNNFKAQDQAGAVIMLQLQHTLVSRSIRSAINILLQLSLLRFANKNDDV